MAIELLFGIKLPGSERVCAEPCGLKVDWVYPAVVAGSELGGAAAGAGAGAGCASGLGSHGNWARFICDSLCCHVYDPRVSPRRIWYVHAYGVEGWLRQKKRDAVLQGSARDMSLAAQSEVADKMTGRRLQQLGWPLKRDPKVLGRPPGPAALHPLSPAPWGARGSRRGSAPTLVATLAGAINAKPRESIARKEGA